MKPIRESKHLDWEGKHMKSEPNPFEKWVLKQRPYCEWRNCLKPSVRVLNLGDAREMMAVCEEHSPSEPT